MGQTTTNTTATNRTRYGGFFNARKQDGGLMELLPIEQLRWAYQNHLGNVSEDRRRELGREFDTLIESILAEAWDHAFQATCDAHDTYGGLNYTPWNPYKGNE